MHIALFLKMTYQNQILFTFFYTVFFLESYFFDEQSKFLDVRFYWNKKFKHRFIYERKLK